VALEQEKSISQRRGLQVSSILDAALCNMLEDPSNEFGWQADQDSLDAILATIQEALDVPTTGAPAVVAFCTDGSRAAQVIATFLKLLGSVVLQSLASIDQYMCQSSIIC
jgi:hypothetical protein